ncbi:MAG: acyl carrier protein [Candidatus Izemoplasmatales bacterium]|nr:acyl carrier protein [Candidatus Izemoplasmatales bacterium]
MKFEHLQNLISDSLGIEKDKITLEADLIADLGADSLDAAELMMAIEDMFEVEVTDEEAQRFKTVGEIWQFIVDKKSI